MYHSFLWQKTPPKRIEATPIMIGALMFDGVNVSAGLRAGYQPGRC